MSSPALYLVLLALSAGASSQSPPPKPGAAGVLFFEGRLDHASFGNGMGLRASWLRPVGEHVQLLATLSARTFAGARWQFGTITADTRFSSRWIASAEASFGGGQADENGGGERSFGYETQKVLLGWLHPGGRFGAMASVRHIDVDASRGFLTEGRVELLPRPELTLTLAYGTASGERLSGRFALAQFRYGSRRKVSGGIALGQNDAGSDIVLADHIPTLHVYGGMSFPCRASELAVFAELQRINGAYRQAVLLSWKVPL